MPADDLPAVTDVLSLIDQLIVSSQSASPEMMVDDLIRLRSLFELAVCELLMHPTRPELARETAPLLDQLGDWLVNQGAAGSPVTIITTNYDFVLEEAICRRIRRLGLDPEKAVDYGFTWRSGPMGELIHRSSTPMVRFIRLHGASNWLRCRLCGFVYISQYGPTFHQSDRAKDDYGNMCHCSALRLQRVIVAPSIVRRVDDADLLTLWKAALEELRLASQWAILGYSLPNEDVAIRSIFIRALRGRSDPPRVRIYERSATPEPRFRFLFGNTVEFSCGGVEEFIDTLPS
jgi:hypothetical protein